MARLLHRLRIAAWTVMAKRRERSVCPSCGSAAGTPLGRVRVVFESARCSECGLVYRIPTRTPPYFYDRSYLESTVWWQEYRSGALARDAAQAYRGTKWDYYDKISLLQAATPSGRVLDFGGGSGVIARQLQETGFTVDLFEVSAAAGTIARELLQIPTFTDTEALRAGGGMYDVILLHHVLEHVDDLPALFALLHGLLAPAGVLWIFVPNGGADQWAGAPERVLDAAHVCAFEPAFFERNLARFDFEGVTFSTPYAFADSGAAGELTHASGGVELAVAAWHAGTPVPAPFRQWPFVLPDLRASVRAQAGC
jgi:SAM-dependent methyltransferase